jgi:hypothetical protein
MTTKIWVDDEGGADLLDCSKAKYRRIARADPRFPKARLFGDTRKRLVEELVEYAKSTPTVEPGSRGLRGEATLSANEISRIQKTRRRAHCDNHADDEAGAAEAEAST